MQDVPKGNAVVDQALTPAGVITLDAKQLAHNSPERVLWVCVILLFAYGALAGKTAQNQDMRIAARHRRKPGRDDQGPLALHLQQSPRHQFHVAGVAAMFQGIFCGDVHAANHFAKQPALCIDIEVNYVQAAHCLVQQAESL